MICKSVKKSPIGQDCDKAKKMVRVEDAKNEKQLIFA